LFSMALSAAIGHLRTRALTRAQKAQAWLREFTALNRDDEPLL
jgi:hypothetical protein